MLAPTEVTLHDLQSDLIRPSGPEAERVYLAWRSRTRISGYEEVIPFVEGFTHRFLYEITEDLLEEVKRRSKHALGDLVREVVELEGMENFHAPFANQFLFHMYLEQQRRVPSWEEWWNWLKGEGSRFYIDVVKRERGYDALSQKAKDRMRDAVQWRLGKAYYSAFREIELLTRLRTRYGLPVKYHMLADVLFKVDFWLNQTLISIYFGNPKYREGTSGRKQHAEAILGRAYFTFPEVTLTRQGHGRFWIVSNKDLEALVNALS